jgi:hypothetical protein
MKIILLFALCFGLYAEDVVFPISQGQVSKELFEKLENKMSVDCKNLTIAEFAELICKKSGLFVLLAPNLAHRMNKDVTVKVDAMSIQMIFQFVAKITGLNFRIVDGAVYISNLK